jgi:predicted acyltransferase
MMEWDLKVGCCLFYNGDMDEIFACVLIFSVYSLLYLLFMNVSTPVANNRSLALDVFRGMTVCFMIIVNTGLSPSFSQLEHSAWHGFTPTDLVFPSFLFAVGNALSFGMKKLKAMSQAAAVWKILKRTALIFLIGYILYWFPFVHQGDDGHWALNPISHTRIFGVLERIALCYGATALLIYYFSSRTVYIISALLLLGYWIILLLYPVTNGDPFGMLTNAGYRLDVWVIGQDHMYHGEGVAFDPEGILSTLPAIVNVVIGYYTGVFISKHGKTYEGLTKLLLWGCGFLALAWFWNLVFPVNKKIWTSSFVCLTVGLDMVLLSFLTYIIEFKQKAAWTPFFTVLGKNPLFVYIVSETLITIFSLIPVGHDRSFADLAANGILSIVPGKFGSLLFAVSYMMICWCVGKYLDMKKIYVRI